jgi:signal transduction histidine kinase
VQGHVKFANEAFYKMTGLRAAQVLDQPAAVVDGLLRALCAEPGEYPGLEALFGSGGVAPEGNAAAPAAAAPGAVAERLRLTLAQPRALVLEVVGLRGESQAVSRLLYLRDITHETEVERMKSAFLHTAAHELRTPMTAIHSCVDLLTTARVRPDKRRQLLDIAHRHSRTLMPSSTNCWTWRGWRRAAPATLNSRTLFWRNWWCRPWATLCRPRAAPRPSCW